MILVNRNKSLFLTSSGFAVYLKREVEKALGITPQEFRRLRSENSEDINKYKLNTYVDGDRIIISTSGYVENLRPPSVPIDMWRNFVSAMVRKYGYENLDKKIEEEINKFIKDKIYLAVVKVFGNEHWIWRVGDPSKLPEDLVSSLPEPIRDFIYSEASNRHSKEGNISVDSSGDSD